MPQQCTSRCRCFFVSKYGVGWSCMIGILRYIRCVRYWLILRGIEYIYGCMHLSIHSGSPLVTVGNAIQGPCVTKLCVKIVTNEDLITVASRRLDGKKCGKGCRNHKVQVTHNLRQLQSAATTLTTAAEAFRGWKTVQLALYMTHTTQLLIKISSSEIRSP